MMVIRNHNHVDNDGDRSDEYCHLYDHDDQGTGGDDDCDDRDDDCDDGDDDVDDGDDGECDDDDNLLSTFYKIAAQE